MHEFSVHPRVFCSYSTGLISYVDCMSMFSQKYWHDSTSIDKLVPHFSIVPTIYCTPTQVHQNMFYFPNPIFYHSKSYQEMFSPVWVKEAAVVNACICQIWPARDVYCYGCMGIGSFSNVGESV